MCAEASTVLRAVAVDFFFNCWYLEIPSDNHVRHIRRCVHYHAQGLELNVYRHSVGSSTFHNLIGLHGLFYRDSFTVKT
jgi:hypothetical protein